MDQEKHHPHENFDRISLEPLDRNNLSPNFSRAVNYWGLEDQSISLYRADFAATHGGVNESSVPQDKSEERRQNRLELYQSLLAIANSKPKLQQLVDKENPVVILETHYQLGSAIFALQRYEGIDFGINLDTDVYTISNRSKGNTVMIKISLANIIKKSDAWKEPLQKSITKLNSSIAAKSRGAV